MIRIILCDGMPKLVRTIRHVDKDRCVVAAAPMVYAKAIGLAPSSLPWMVLQLNRIRDWLNRRFKARFKLVYNKPAWKPVKPAPVKLTPAQHQEVLAKLNELTGASSPMIESTSEASLRRVLEVNAKYHQHS